MIVGLCAEGRWKATGKKPGSAEREDIPDIHFIGSEIDRYTGDLMSTPGGGYLANYSGGFIGQGARLRGGRLRFKPGEWKPVGGPGSKVALWTELMFSVPGGADEGKVAELPEPDIEDRGDDDNAAVPQKTKKEQKVLPSTVGRKKGQGSLARSDKPLVQKMHKLIEGDEEEASVLSAAEQFAGEAKGGGTRDSKIDRLRKRYREEYPLKKL